MSKENATSFDFLYKVIVIGDSGVGKSCLLSRFVLNEFDEASKSTIGVEFFTKIISLGDKTIKAQLWDTAGQEKYYAITNAYYRGAVGAILVYDVTDSQSFKNMDKWIMQLKERATHDIVSIIIANKIDLKSLRAVSASAGEELAEHNDMLFMEASAMNAKNVEKAIELMIKKVHQRQTRKRRQSQRKQPYILPAVGVHLELDVTVPKNDKKSCC